MPREKQQQEIVKLLMKLDAIKYDISYVDEKHEEE
jgi:hypothetical protein